MRISAVVALITREMSTDLVLLHNVRVGDSPGREGYSQSAEVQGDRTTFESARIRDGI